MPFVPDEGEDLVNFAQPISNIVLAPIAAPTIASAPTAGAGLALNESGKISPALLASAPATVSSSGAVTLTTAAQDLTGVTTTVAEPGTYIAIATADIDGTATGWGQAYAQLLVDGVMQTGVAIIGDTGTANHRVTTAQTWIVPVVAPQIIFKVQALKTVNLGTVTVNTVHTKLLVFRIA